MKERVTINDVAAASGVSKATVSYVLNGKKKVSEETKNKILDVIQKMGFVPDLNARGLSNKDTKLIGVVIPQTEPGTKLMFHNYFYSELLENIEYHARQLGYHVIISATDVTQDYLNLIQERNLDGVIIVGTYQNEFYNQLHKLEVPVVLVDSYCKYDWFQTIRIDDAHSSYIATKYILEQGHKEVALVTGRIQKDGVMQKRLEGFKQALFEAGIEFNENSLFETTVDYESGVNVAPNILSRNKNFTAVIATADVIAVGLIKGFHNCGVRVPEDISIMGFDDLLISQYIVPGLTTIKQPISVKGEKAVNMLVENMKDPYMKRREEILEVQLVIRGSVKKLSER